MRASLLKAVQAEALGEHLKKKRPRIKKRLRKYARRRGFSSTRTDSYNGFEIEIVTTYDIKVNGKRFEPHVHVMNNGHVHYHPLPNYSWASAVDFVRQLIDSFPEDFASFQKKPKKKKSTKKKKTTKPSYRKKKTSRKKKKARRKKERK